MTIRSHHSPICLTRQELAAFVDGECRPAEAGTVRDHLKSCPTCLAEVNALAALNQALRDLGRDAAAPGSWARVSTSLGDQTRAVSPQAGAVSRRMWISGGLAAASVAAGAVYFAATPRLNVVTASINDFTTYRDKGWTVDLTSRDGASLAAWAQQRVAFAMPEPKASLMGFDVGGIRLCWLLNRRLIGLTYARVDARAVLYIMESHSLPLPEPDRTLRSGIRAAVQHVKGHGVAVWSERDLVFVLVAAEPAFASFLSS